MRRAMRAGLGTPSRTVRVTPEGSRLEVEWTVGFGPRVGSFELVMFATAPRGRCEGC
jgi:hypothetical protein